VISDRRSRSVEAAVPAATMTLERLNIVLQLVGAQENMTSGYVSVMDTFDFMRQFSVFATCALGRGP
jgi:hypothetical protein